MIFAYKLQERGGPDFRTSWHHPLPSGTVPILQSSGPQEDPVFPVTILWEVAKEY
jgi:hypothetical protein